MRPMLDDLELPQIQEITTLDRRVVAEHKPPGFDGSVLQNLGRRPTRLTLWGVTTGPGALRFIEQLNDKYRAGGPLAFTADITADAEIEQMIIDDLQTQDLAGKPERYAYALTLREYIEPVEREDTSLVDADILDDALGFIDDLTAGFEFLDVLSRFISRLTELHQNLQREGTNAFVPSS